MRDIRSPLSLQMAPSFECPLFASRYWVQHFQQLWSKCVGYISIWNGAGRNPLVVDQYVFSSEEQQQQQQKCDFIPSFSLKWREQREMESFLWCRPSAASCDFPPGISKLYYVPVQWLHCVSETSGSDLRHKQSNQQHFLFVWPPPTDWSQSSLSPWRRALFCSNSLCSPQSLLIPASRTIKTEVCRETQWPLSEVNITIFKN